ncbi:MAG: hypothetical protein SF339_10710 [Blastocatellia bacterium]|nr:hypothetical protein [Blastocatellia bacterium]
MWIGISVIITAAFSIGATWLVRGAANRYGYVAAPRKDRWHQKPTALMGGIAIYLAFVLGIALFAPSLTRAYPILIPATILFITGLVDDLVQLKPHIKLAMQLAAASITVFGGLDLHWTSYDLLNDTITIIWLVGITNAVNLLDNMDGLAGGISLIASVFLTITFFLNGQAAEASVTLVMAGAIVGFLVFNFNPATIFMGDCGSMFLGFLLGGVALLSDVARMRNLLGVLLTPVLILMIPIFDTVFVTFARKLYGRPVSQGGRDHTSHRLVALGMSERRAVLMLYLFAAVSGVLALAVRQMNLSVGFLLTAGFALGVISLGLYLGKVRVYEEGGTSVMGTLVDVLKNFSHGRRIVEILLDFILIVLAYYSAYALRFDGEIPGEQIAILLKTLPLVIAVQILVFLITGVYRGIWRYAGVDDLVTIAKGVVIGASANGLIVLAFYRFFGPSRAVFILYGLLLFLFVGASRLSFRLLAALLIGQPRSLPDARPVLIYGAGDGGAILVSELLNNPGYRYHPIGFIDDDASKAGKKIRGYRIFRRSELPELISAHNVREVLISSIKVPESQLDSLRDLGINLKRLKIEIN